MRAARWALLLAVAVALPVAWAGAAPQARQSVSPIVGDWSKDGYAGPVLRVGWQPRGLHGPKTAEIYADVLQDFRFFSDGCLHRQGERLFEVSNVGAWPGQFAGTGTVLDGDTRTSNACGSVGSKVAVSVSAYPSSATPGYGLNICFTRDSGGTVCSSSLVRAAAPGEKVTTAETPQYVAPGQFKPLKGAAGVSFIVDAAGTFVNPVGRWIANVSVRAKQTCQLWSPQKRRWSPSGSGVKTVSLPQHVAIGSSLTVSTTIAGGTAKVLNRITLQSAFSDWTHLSGKARVLTYISHAPTMPKNPDKPGAITVERCDTGSLDFTSQHVPGSWQGIAGSRGG